MLFLRNIKYKIRLSLARNIFSWLVAIISLFLLEKYASFCPTSLVGWVCVISMFFAYAMYIYSLHQEFGSVKEVHILRIVSLYLLMTLIIVILYAGYYALFNLIGGKDWEAFDFNKAIYFSVVTFTTLGYGDYAPINDVGRYIVSSQAIIGTLHMVTFVSLWLSKLIQSNNRAGTA